MKLRNHKTIVITAAIGLIYAAGLGFAYNEYVNKPLPALRAYTPVKVATPEKSAETVTPVDKVTVAKVSEVADTPTIETPVAPENPKVLSTQEYGEKYLDLSTPQLQECFNAIVAAFPDRFTGDVRERNIKALTVYATPCSPGYGGFADYKRIWDMKYPNGSFFDSDIAKSQW